MGQVFDPSAFSAVVVYSNDSIKTLEGAVTASAGFDSSSMRVSQNLQVTADVGTDISGAPVTQEIYAKVYPIDSLTVTANYTEPVGITTASGDIDVEDSDFTVVANYNNGSELPLVPTTDFTVDATIEGTLTEDAREGKANASVTVFGSQGSLPGSDIEFDVVYTYETPETDYSNYNWDGRLAYAIVPASVDNDLRYFKNGEFDGESMIQLFKVATKAGVTGPFYVLIDNADVEYTLATGGTKFPSAESVIVDFKYSYVVDEAYKEYATADEVTYVLSGVYSVADGIYLGASRADAADNNIVINLKDDYAVALKATTVDKYYVPGDVFNVADVKLNVEYASGYSRDYTSDDGKFSVSQVTFTKDDIGTKAIPVKLNVGPEANYPETAATETTVAVQVVENYPTAISLVAGVYKPFNENYSIDDFVPTITWADAEAGAEYDEENPAPVTFSYTFEPVAPSASQIGGSPEVKYTWVCNELPDLTGEGTVNITVVNIPVSVTFDTTETTLSANQSIADYESRYTVTVKWADGTTGIKDGFQYTLDQEYATPTGENDGSGTVGATIQLTGSWTCNGNLSGKVDNVINVTLN